MCVVFGSNKNETKSRIGYLKGCYMCLCVFGLNIDPNMRQYKEMSYTYVYTSDTNENQPD